LAEYTIKKEQVQQAIDGKDMVKFKSRKRKANEGAAEENERGNTLLDFTHNSRACSRFSEFCHVLFSFFIDEDSKKKAKLEKSKLSFADDGEEEEPSMYFFVDHL
jgi:hypothetical protein